MRVTLEPDDLLERKNATVIWLMRILEAPTLSGTELPSSIRMYLYIDGQYKHVSRGAWEINSDQIYLAKPSTSVSCTPYIKLGILAAIAHFTGASEDPRIIEKLSARLVETIKENTLNVYSSIVRAGKKPSYIAIDQANAKIAAQLDGKWLSPSGAPVEIDPSWVVMGF